MNTNEREAAERLLIEALPVAAALADASASSLPIVYANPAFEALAGRSAAEPVAGLSLFGEVVAGGGGCDPPDRWMQAAREGWVAVRIGRPDGRLVSCEMQATAVTDANGCTVRWALALREAQAGRAERGAGAGRETAAAVVTEVDPVTGLASRAFLEAILALPAAAPWGRGPGAAAFAIDVDDLGGYNATFGRAAGDALLRRVAAALRGGFRRASDRLARWEGGTFAGFTHGLDEAQATRHAQALRTRVHDLKIHHPHSRYGRYVSVSVTAAAATSDAAEPRALLERALGALPAAKGNGQPGLVAPAPRRPPAPVTPRPAPVAAPARSSAARLRRRMGH